MSKSKKVAAPASTVVHANGAATPKTKCPISRKSFKTAARPLTLTLGDGKTLIVEVKEFSTGSLGWYYSGKLFMDVAGVRVPMQVGVSFVVAHSKELPAD